MRVLANILIVIVIGLAVGGLTANYSIQKSHGIGAINAGPWSAWPFVGGSEVDPYTSAKAAADGTIPLGAAEGLAFEAVTDSEGKPLSANCQYAVSGETSAARLWTLAAYNASGELVSSGKEPVSAIFSGNLVRYPDSSFLVNISDVPRSGNWLALSGKGPFKLVLRLYDTPITSNSGLINPQMPRIRRKVCS